MFGEKATIEDYVKSGWKFEICEVVDSPSRRARSQICLYLLFATVTTTRVDTSASIVLVEFRDMGSGFLQQTGTTPETTFSPTTTKRKRRPHSPYQLLQPLSPGAR